MKPGWRSFFILLGSVLLSSAFIGESWSAPPHGGTVGLVVVLLLSMSFLCYLAGALIAPKRSVVPIVTGTFTSVFLLLNPLLCHSMLLEQPMLAVRGAAFILILFVAWRSVETWSLFMRSVTLLIILSGAIYWNTGFTDIMVGALFLCAIFNRRPAIAMFSSGGIVLVAWLLATSVEKGFEFLHDHVSWFPSSLLPAAGLAEGSFGVLSAWSAREGIQDRCSFAIQWISLPWILMGFYVASKQIYENWQQRRTGAEDWLAYVFVLLALQFTFFESEPLVQVAVLLALSLAIAPLVAKSVAQRDLFWSRWARSTAGASSLLSMAVIFLTPDKLVLPASILSLVGAYLYSRIVLSGIGPIPRDRIVAILAGATLGAWLAKGILLFRTASVV